jgi:hypothetical protein
MSDTKGFGFCTACERPVIGRYWAGHCLPCAEALAQAYGVEPHELPQAMQTLTGVGLDSARVEYETPEVEHGR